MHLSQSLPMIVLGTFMTIIPSTATPVAPSEPVITNVPPTASSEYTVTKIFEYDGSGFENLVFRSNGQLLTTTAFPSGLLFYIDPFMIRPGVVLHNFTSISSTLGITELAPDMFYVAGEGTNQGPLSIFLVDMTDFLILPNGTIFTPPNITEIGTLTDAASINGVTYLDRSDNFLLCADSILGGVWKFNVDTGESEMSIKDDSMAGPANNSSFAGLGINGLRTQNRTLFYCNSGAQAFYKMPLLSNGSSAGNATLINSSIACDDFALDPLGFAYVASPDNALIRLDTQTGEQLVIAGTFNSTKSDIISASSVRFGVTADDETSVYITTNGGSMTDAPKGSQGISRVDVSDLARMLY